MVGLAQLNRFEVIIIAPVEGPVPAYGDDRHVSFRVEEVTMFFEKY